MGIYAMLLEARSVLQRYDRRSILDAFARGNGRPRSTNVSRWFVVYP